MRRPPKSANWVKTRLTWTIIGVFVGASIGVEIADWILGWNHLFWTVPVGVIVCGGLGLWRDVYQAREWRDLGRSED